MSVRDTKYIQIYNECKRHKMYSSIMNVRDTKCIQIYYKCKRHKMYSNI